MLKYIKAFARNKLDLVLINFNILVTLITLSLINVYNYYY